MVGEDMQLLWHCVVNMSFGYLTLIATVRIVQELMVLGSLMSNRSR
jgi:hypothetical protein